MRHIKHSVLISILEPQMLDGILISHSVYIDAGEEFFISSVTDSKHGKDSLHPKGRAIDVRTWNLKHKTPEQMAELLRAALGRDYDVVVEQTHIHIEYDPE